DGWAVGRRGEGSSAVSAARVAVVGGLAFTTVSAGPCFACGVTTSGAAYCWGGNGAGQLGTGTQTSSLTPVPVAGGLAFTTVSVGGGLGGGGFACGITTVGAAYCWGDNIAGELGI